MTQAKLSPTLSPDARCAPASGRAILQVSGEDRVKLLQGLVTQDLERVARDGIGYSALLTPQGKLIADFMLVHQEDALLIDMDEALAEDLARRLTMFKLRSKAEIARLEMPVTRGIGPMPEGALEDPRHPSLGWRLYGAALEQGEPVDWDALRIAARVPKIGLELQSGDSFILELGFERLHGVDFRKGCFVGQEVTARMHHRTSLRRRLMVVSLSQPVPAGSVVVNENDREVGVVYTQAEGRGLAHLRVDRAEGVLRAGEAEVRVLDSGE
ncbi:YgfZ/GcvT domain-containing protein [Pararhodobacter oceanensis]|uniref:Folate-binding protein YgfZ n=1 Tax=Pararhodobacter oceanensis TaxID=2172121 RepID=A0A2T8HYG1_9RHOB|nr:folate-binding protein YgfZ [Pararhodobacter oceanensis]PVH30457.1 folate-binding protein YgfZ [Pararhodobacter oceanensis]